MRGRLIRCWCECAISITVLCTVWDVRVHCDIHTLGFFFSWFYEFRTWRISLIPLITPRLSLCGGSFVGCGKEIELWTRLHQICGWESRTRREQKVWREREEANNYLCTKKLAELLLIQVAVRVEHTRLTGGACGNYNSTLFIACNQFHSRKQHPLWAHAPARLKWISNRFTSFWCLPYFHLI